MCITETTHPLSHLCLGLTIIMLYPKVHSNIMAHSKKASSLNSFKESILDFLFFSFKLDCKFVIGFYIRVFILYFFFLFGNFRLYIVSNDFKWRAPCKPTLLKGNPTPDNPC